MGRSRLFTDDERKERHRISNLAYVKRIQEKARITRESLPKPSIDEVLVKKAQQREGKNARRKALWEERRNAAGITPHRKYFDKCEVRQAKNTCSANWKARNKEAVNTYSTNSNLAISMGIDRNEVPAELLNTKIAILNVTRKLKELMK